VFLMAFAVMLLPLIRLALYSAPWYDDYMYGNMTRGWMIQLNMDNFWGAVVGAYHCAKTEWYAWQGTYSSVFLMGLMPAIWGEENYCWGAIFLIVFLAASLFVLVKVLVKDVLKADWASCVALQAATAITVIMLIYTAQGGFYWYTGGIHYVGMHSALLLLVSCIICLLKTRKKSAAIIYVICSMLGALIVAGSNYVTILQGALVILSVAALGAWFYRKRALLLLPAVCIYAIGFYYNVSAPGNAVRAESFVGMGYDPLKAVLYSFVEAFRHIGEFTGLITVAIMVMLLPVMWYMVKRCSFRFRYPVLVLLWSFCLYATGFTPSLFSMGHAGLSRVLNAVKITYQLLLLLNEVYMLGWLKEYLEKKGKLFAGERVQWWFYPVMGVIMLGIFSVSPNKTGNYSAYGAYRYIHSGEAYNFYQQYMERVEVLKSDQQVIVFEPYGYRPWFLSSGELSEDPDAEQNRAVASWYDKESVSVRESE